MLSRLLFYKINIDRIVSSDEENKQTRGAAALMRLRCRTSPFAFNSHIDLRHRRHPAKFVEFNVFYDLTLRFAPMCQSCWDNKIYIYISKLDPTFVVYISPCDNLWLKGWLTWLSRWQWHLLSLLGEKMINDSWCLRWKMLLGVFHILAHFFCSACILHNGS